MVARKSKPVMHVALLRGINVGKAKRIAMSDLRALCESLGYGNVKTLLNSGNVVALPTDPFFGLAADPATLKTVDRSYDLKTRARHKPRSLLSTEVT